MSTTGASDSDLTFELFGGRVRISLSFKDYSLSRGILRLRVHRVGVLQGQPEGFPSHVTSVRLPRKRSHCFLTPAQLSTGECVGALGVQASEIVL